VDTFTNLRDVPRYARMVGLDEIEKNDFNLNLPRYIDSQMSEDKQDIDGHLNGGIPAADVDALAPYWQVCPDLRDALFSPNRPGYVDLAVEKAAIKTTIYDHPQFRTFVTKMNAHFDQWRTQATARLKTLEAGFHPKDLVAELAEDLLTHYTGKPLIDAYDVYQHLMEYWAETMQDDCYQIAADGWKAEPTRIIETDKKGKEKDKGWTCDLIPKPLIVARYYPQDQAAIDKLTAELDDISAKLAEMEEEHGGEDGLFSELDKVNKANVAARLKEIKGDKESKDEAEALKAWLDANTKEAALKKRLKEAEAALDNKALNHYPKLTEAEIKTLVVEDKWLASLDAAIHGEMDRLSQRLTQRVKELAERYETPLPRMAKSLSDLEAKVNAHLKKMGFTWA
jgi:type I restriction enzyme M protein